VEEDQPEMVGPLSLYSSIGAGSNFRTSI
jgi:hypothetical protein